MLRNTLPPLRSNELFGCASFDQPLELDECERLLLEVRHEQALPVERKYPSAGLEWAGNKCFRQLRDAETPNRNAKCDITSLRKSFRRRGKTAIA
jgi:hypothetical protein